MSATLVHVETQQGQPTRGSLGMLALARSMGEAAAYVGGMGAAVAVETLARHGADVVWVCDDPAIVPELAGGHIDALAALVDDHGYDLVLLENSVVAADIAAGLAARLEAGVNWDLQTLTRQADGPVGTRSSPDESATIEVGWAGDVALAVMRAGLHDPKESPGQGRVASFRPVFAAHSAATVIDAREDEAGGAGGQVERAEIVVAGGRGLRERASLQLLDELAAVLGGTVAATLPLVDRAWCRRDQLVGLSGARVRPHLYLACGVSGAVGHRVGMERSDVIVAIDTDPDAPILSICDVGVVGDLHVIVPELTRLIRERVESSADRARR